MKYQPFVIWILCAGLILSFAHYGTAQTSTEPVTTQQEVKLDAPTFDAVVDQLFGAPEGGLLDGTKSFQLHVKNMELTALQSADFFSATSTENLATLVTATETLHGVVHIQGEIEGQDFDLKISGHQLKLDGVALTAAQLDALVAGLKDVDGLKQIKITAMVDGEKTTIRLQGNLLKSDSEARATGRANGRQEDREIGRENERNGLDRALEVRNERADRVERLGRIERPERPEGRR
jgi:hypothetical protein